MLHDHAPDLVPMDENERAYAQWQQHQQALPEPPQHQQPAALHAAGGVNVVGGEHRADVVVNNLPAIAATAATFTVEKAQRFVPAGRPLLLIREVSHQQLLDMVNDSQQLLEQSTRWEHLMGILTWLLLAASLAILVALAVSFCANKSKSPQPAKRPAPLQPLRRR